MKFNLVICRYSEIALKKKNRSVFEQYLLNRISTLLKPQIDLKVTKIRGRILIHYFSWKEFTEADCTIIRNSLNFIFGLDSFSFVSKTDVDVDIISNLALASVKDEIEKVGGTKKNWSSLSYRVRVKRVDKSNISRNEMEITIANKVLNSYKNLKVDLISADISFYCEVYKDFAFSFYEIEKGQKGLPIGTNPPVLTLLSGGFDSPVAAFKIMSRGVQTDFLSFHSYPFTPKVTEEKVKKIAKYLNKFQGNRTLFLCNLLEVQKIICEKSFESYRTIFYRRMMFRLAERIAEANDCHALVTGESVGQVASQTIQNLKAIEDACNTMVLRPLIGMDKEYTMDLARKIGTYDLSVEQVPDSCTVFSPSNPSTNAALNKILKIEERMDIEELIKLAWSNTIAVNLKSDDELTLDDFFSKKRK